ncbi:MAG: hypothetical protein LAO21_22890 [Acidobacteriia bacterium]|nr:hypothetical protein [Terriglobia bacterium]
MFLNRAPTQPLNRNDAVLYSLLALSLLFNVFLGWKIRALQLHSVQGKQISQNAQGMTVEPFRVFDLNGPPTIIDFKSPKVPTVLYIFNPNCKWCDRNNQNIAALSTARKDSFRFIGLSLRDPNLEKYVKAGGLQFPIYSIESYGAISELRLGATPQTIVIAPNGTVTQDWIGAYNAETQKNVENYFTFNLPGLNLNTPD